MGTTLPKTRAAVPAWLSVVYGVQFVNGEPDIPGWLATTARAESIIENPSVAWCHESRRGPSGYSMAR